jgi:hypothetical protein
MNRKLFLLLVAAFALAACSQTDEQTESESGSEAAESASPDYVVMGEELQQLKDDFNANRGRVRLVFLSGPTCGICLRGMADLNDEFIADVQNDDRLVTFVVHVPTMGAKEHHAADSIPLLNGPRVHHYWEESGIIGQHYSEVMGVRMYVWDFWTIYGPDAVWQGTLPPVPDYYEHQLGVTSGGSRGFPKDRVLDAERFASETRKHIGICMWTAIPAILSGRICWMITTSRCTLLLRATSARHQDSCFPIGSSIWMGLAGHWQSRRLKKSKSL